MVESLVKWTYIIKSFFFLVNKKLNSLAITVNDYKNLKFQKSSSCDTRCSFCNSRSTMMHASKITCYMVHKGHCYKTLIFTILNCIFFYFKISQQNLHSWKCKEAYKFLRMPWSLLHLLDCLDPNQLYQTCGVPVLLHLYSRKTCMQIYCHLLSVQM